MDAIGIGIQTIGSALKVAAIWAGICTSIFMGLSAFLIYTNTITFEDFKNLIKENRNNKNRRFK